MRNGVILMGGALLMALIVVSGSALADTSRHGWYADAERQQRWTGDERQGWPRRGERRDDVRPRPRVEVVVPLMWLPPASQPDVPPSPAVPPTPDEPSVLDCRGLAERIELLRDSHTVGTRQLRERRELEARYRRACQ